VASLPAWWPGLAQGAFLPRRGEGLLAILNGPPAPAPTAACACAGAWGFCAF